MYTVSMTDKKYLTLTEKECRRRSVIESYCDKHIKQTEGAKELWISTRQFRRLVRGYKREWDIWLIHWLRGRTSNHKQDEERAGQVRLMMNEEIYEDFWPTFLSEELGDRGIKVSDEWMRQFMMKEWKWEWKKQKAMTIRNRRARKWTRWEMVQYDGSYHYWFEDRLDEEFCLLVGIDDATGDLMQLWMGDNEWWESTVGYWMKYMPRYWVPEIIYVDKFATYKVNHPKATNDKKLITNFERCLRKLGCLLIKANSPQAKGRVERANETLQDRLLLKMRLAGISDVNSANEWIDEVYIPRHNKKFGKVAEKEGDKHRKLTDVERENLRWIFSLESTRTVQCDYVINYKSRTYQLKPEWVTRLYTKTKCIVQEDIYWEIQVIANEKIIPYNEINSRIVKINRAMYRAKQKSEQERLARVKMLARVEEREMERKRISKERQTKWRAAKLIKITKTRMS
jgi:hypothetical protein